ncbi:MAG: hypothetical protein Aurels2KO_37850 [Aureliella sp.]
MLGKRWSTWVRQRLTAVDRKIAPIDSRLRENELLSERDVYELDACEEHVRRLTKDTAVFVMRMILRRHFARAGESGIRRAGIIMSAATVRLLKALRLNKLSIIALSINRCRLALSTAIATCLMQQRRQIAQCQWQANEYGEAESDRGSHGAHRWMENLIFASVRPKTCDYYVDR